MTSVLPILDAALTPDQTKLLDAMLWHVTKKVDHADMTTWSTWDFITGTLEAEGIDQARANRAVAELPTLARVRYPYSLIWRSSAGASVVIQPTETVGLTLAGLYRVDPHTANRMAQMMARFAEREGILPPNPYGVRQENHGLNDTIIEFLDGPTRAGRVHLNVHTAAEMLMHEYTPLASATGFQWIYDVPLGSARLTHLRGVEDAPSYLRAISTLAPAADQNSEAGEEHAADSGATNTATPVVAQARRPDLLNRRAREAVRDHMSGTVLRDIDEMWQDERFPPSEDPEPVGGERVTRFQGYLNQVDWTDLSHVARALRVFEVGLDFLFHPDPAAHWDPSSQIQRLRRLFSQDGYNINDDGKIVGGPTIAITPALLNNLTDPAVILGHLSRIDAAIEREDPAQAIGSAKELVESTAKLILKERSFQFTKDDDMTSLVNRAMEALAVHPKSASGGPDGGGAVKRILGSAIAVTGGMSELRNTYGTGHGPYAAPSALGVRHARLAINSAKLWCEFVIDTLADARAPWQSSPPVPGPSR